jgi:hypothetical protein
MTEQKENLINDTRKIEDFVGLTFSLFKKSQVKKALFESLNKGSLEISNYWVAEYICCGAFLDLWDTILRYTSCHIHLGNPRLPIYLARRFQDFKNIAMNDYVSNQLEMRNSKRIRQLFAEIIGVLCLSTKKNKLELIKLDKAGEFDITNLSNKLKAPSIKYAESVMLEDDPKELFIAINELGYNLSKEVKNTLVACYWIEWILAFESARKKKKEKCVCAKRQYMPVEGDAMFDIIFIVWDIILQEVKIRNNKILEEIIKSLCNLFCIKFNSSSKKKRKFILYHAVSLLCETPNYNIKIFDNVNILQVVKKKIDLIYLQIKQNEIIESEESLRKEEIEKQKANNKNFANTLVKLEMMNNNDFIK